MLIAILIAFLLVAAAYSIHARSNGGLIGEHRYNNRYNDATGAREDSLN
jgi:hypothetical protein